MLPHFAAPIEEPKQWLLQILGTLFPSPGPEERRGRSSTKGNIVLRLPAAAVEELPRRRALRPRRTAAGPRRGYRRGLAAISRDLRYAGGDDPPQCGGGGVRERQRLLHGEQVDLADVGRRREQLVGLAHQRRRDLALEVRLAAGLVVERVEDAEAARAGCERVPRRAWRAPARRAPARRCSSSATAPSLTGLGFEQGDEFRASCADSHGDGVARAPRPCAATARSGSGGNDNYDIISRHADRCARRRRRVRYRPRRRCSTRSRPRTSSPARRPLRGRRRVAARAACDTHHGFAVPRRALPRACARIS